MFVYHHEHEADGHEDVCDGHHRLIGRDGQRHGRRRVRHHDDGEQEDEERLRRRLQSWTANQNKASDVTPFTRFTSDDHVTPLRDWPIMKYATQLKMMAGMVRSVRMSDRILDRKYTDSL